MWNASGTPAPRRRPSELRHGPPRRRAGQHPRHRRSRAWRLARCHGGCHRAPRGSRVGPLGLQFVDARQQHGWGAAAVRHVVLDDLRLHLRTQRLAENRAESGWRVRKIELMRERNNLKPHIIYIYIYIPTSSKVLLFYQFSQNLLSMCWRCFLLAATFFSKMSVSYMFLESSWPLRNIKEPHFFTALKKDLEEHISIALAAQHASLTSCNCVLSRLALQTKTSGINRTGTLEVRLVRCPKPRHVWEHYWKYLERKCDSGAPFPGLKRNGVNYRQNGVNCRQNGANPNKEISSQSSALEQGFICSHYLYKWQSLSASRLSKKHRIPRIIPVSV